MVDDNELAAGMPSGAMRTSSKEYIHTALRNGMVVHSTWGSLGDGVEGPVHQRLIGQWECDAVELSTQAGDEVFTVDDPEAKWYVAVTTDNRLLASVRRGQTPIGHLRDEDDRTLLGFSWDFDDIASVYVGRVRKLMKWWNEEVIVSATDGTGRFRVENLGPYVGTSARSLAKSLLSAPNGVHHSFVTAFGDAIARHRTGARPEWVVERDRGDETWDLDFTGNRELG
jgi:hypothetical protein